MFSLSTRLWRTCTWPHGRYFLPSLLYLKARPTKPLRFCDIVQVTHALDSLFVVASLGTLFRFVGEGSFVPRTSRQTSLTINWRPNFAPERWRDLSKKSLAMIHHLWWCHIYSHLGIRHVPVAYKIHNIQLKELGIRDYIFARIRLAFNPKYNVPYIHDRHHW